MSDFTRKVEGAIKKCGFSNEMGRTLLSMTTSTEKDDEDDLIERINRLERLEAYNKAKKEAEEDDSSSDANDIEKQVDKIIKDSLNDDEMVDPDHYDDIPPWLGPLVLGIAGTVKEIKKIRYEIGMVDPDHYDDIPPWLNQLVKGISTSLVQEKEKIVSLENKNATLLKIVYSERELLKEIHKEYKINA